MVLRKGEKIGCLKPLQDVCSIELIDEKGQKNSQRRQALEDAIDQLVSAAKNISDSDKRKLRDLLSQFGDVISTGDRDLGKTSMVFHTIDTGDLVPVRQAARRLPYSQRNEVRELLEDMLGREIIEPSKSAWSSPVVLVKKKDGSTRFCVDFRKLNGVTRKDAQPLPRIDDTLDTLGQACLFSTLDLASGYWQVQVDPKDQEKTAFVTPFGLYQFRVMPFGLSNAPATFQRLMEHVLSGLHWSICLVYLDDIIVFLEICGGASRSAMRRFAVYQIGLPQPIKDP